jgi:hypothetical protein
MPAPAEIRAAVERMTVSDVFARSPQLGAFLRFVVEAVLHGKAERIKAYTIGVEVLRRDVKFDPQLDPIVRVEATRLRRTIERYYSGPARATRSSSIFRAARMFRRSAGAILKRQLDRMMPKPA